MLEMPSSGMVFEDARGRELTISRVDPADRLGREVQGTILRPGASEAEPYSCTLTTWVDVWRDRAPAAVFRA